MPVVLDESTEANPALTPAPAEAPAPEATPANATPIEATPANATPTEATPANATPTEATPSEPTPFDGIPAALRRAMLAHGFVDLTAVQRAVLEPEARGTRPAHLVADGLGQDRRRSASCAPTSSSTMPAGCAGPSLRWRSIVDADARAGDCRSRRELRWLLRRAPRGARRGRHRRRRHEPLG
jgi:hypothetical protein